MLVAVKAKGKSYVVKFCVLDVFLNLLLKRKLLICSFFLGTVSDAIHKQREWSFTRTCSLLTTLYRKVGLPGFAKRTLLC